MVSTINQIRTVAQIRFINQTVEGEVLATTGHKLRQRLTLLFAKGKLKRLILWTHQNTIGNVSKTTTFPSTGGINLGLPKLIGEFGRVSLVECLLIIIVSAVAGSFIFRDLADQ